MSKNVKKRFRNIIRTKCVILLVILPFVFAIGCTNQKAEVNLETKTENHEETVKESKGVINNGGLYVGYNGNVYYRQYKANSFKAEGIFCNYDVVAGAKKNMMCIKADGTSEIAFSDTGEGEIYIYNDKMYLQESSGDYVKSVYAINLDGTNKQKIGNGWIKAIDEETGTLICILADESDSYQLNKLDCNTGKTEKYNLAVPFSEFISLKAGVIYYSGEVSRDGSVPPSIKLCSMNIDGKNEKLLVDTSIENYQDNLAILRIPCIQYVGNTIYFSYGAYGGSGNYYQGGKIAKVNKYGSDFKVLSGESVEDMSQDYFYASNVNGQEVLYYSQGFEERKNYALYLSTGKVENSNFEIHPEGKPFENGNGVKVYENSSSKMTTLIPNVDYSNLDLEKEADEYTVLDIEQCDNWIYYKIEANQLNPAADIGWRTGYSRVKTAIVRRQLDGDKVQVLYRY